MSSKMRVLAVALPLVILAVLPISAHHSVGGQFDTTKTITLKGTLTKIDWINPHIYFHVDVKEADGTMTSWNLESVPVAFMRRAGISRNDFVIGQQVTFDAWPARNGTKGLGLITKLTEAGGKFFALAPGANGV